MNTFTRKGGSTPWWGKERTVKRKDTIMGSLLYRGAEVETSEKAGYDIGMETAEKSWSKYHAKKWKASRR